MSKCPDCDGDAHPSYRAHWFKPMANSMANVMANVEKTMANTVVDRMANRIDPKPIEVGGGDSAVAVMVKKAGTLPLPSYKYRDAEARKAYQRELMRKRRAEKRV